MALIASPTNFKREPLQLMRASPSLVAKIKVPVPPIEEQQKIASILDAADNLRQKDQQLIEKYSALSQSLF